MIDPEIRALFEVPYGGLIEAIESLGPGEFKPDSEPIRKIKNGKGQLCDVAFGLRYVFTDKQMLLRIRCSFRREADGSWKRYHYAHHCGPSLESADSYKDTYFRIDLDAANGYHVHLPPFRPRHVPAAEVEPDTVDVDPFRFLGWVRDYRRIDICPLRKRS